MDSANTFPCLLRSSRRASRSLGSFSQKRLTHVWGSSFFLSEFDFSFLTDDQKRRVLEFLKFVFQQLYDQGSRNGANWRSPMVILCESNICFGVVPKGLSNKIVRLVLAMFGCGLQFYGAKKICPPRAMRFSLLLCHRCQVCATPSHPLRLGGLLLLQLLSRHQGRTPFFYKKKKYPGGRCKAVLQLFCGCEG